jgi:hypothetical protein
MKYHGFISQLRKNVAAKAAISTIDAVPNQYWHGSCLPARRELPAPIDRLPRRH